MFMTAPIPVDDDLAFALHREAAGCLARGQPCIDATLGVIVNDDGTLAVLPSVVEAFRGLGAEDWAPYAHTAGLDEYCEAVLGDCFDLNPELRQRAFAVATAGATGALHVALRTFLGPGQHFLIPALSWSAYSVIAHATERQIATFPMLRDSGRDFDVDAFDRALAHCMAEQKRALVVINDPCQNPTGYSMTTANWTAVAEVLDHHARRAPLVVVLDAVYHAFARDGIHTALRALAPLTSRALLLVAWSASKSFTAYGARIGALVAVVPEGVERSSLRDTLSARGCGTWGNCNRGAMRVTALLLTESTRRARTSAERADLIRLLGRRNEALERALRASSLSSPPYRGGFFKTLFTPQAPDIAARLRTQGIYVVPLPGAIRVALSALRSGDVAPLGEALARVT